MGAGQSTSQAHPPEQALHVLRVTPHSPASQTDIEPYFDFVVGFEGDTLDGHTSIDAAKLEAIVEAHEGRVLNLLVWSSKRHYTRVVPVTPSRTWSQKAAAPQGAKPSLLGLSMRMCEPEATMDNVWHVLDVIEGSPAESAGLVPMGDWVLGWSGGVLSQENDFYELVEAHVDKPLRVYVYSHDFDALREVVLVPNRHWGGDGLLGCVFGFGLLHRIPPQPEGRQPGTTPPELQDGYDDAIFVPADEGYDDYSQDQDLYAREQEHFAQLQRDTYAREQAQVGDWRQRQHEHWHPDGTARGHADGTARGHADGTARGHADWTARGSPEGSPGSARGSPGSAHRMQGLPRGSTETARRSPEMARRTSDGPPRRSPETSRRTPDLTRGTPESAHRSSYSIPEVDEDEHLQ